MCRVGGGGGRRDCVIEGAVSRPSRPLGSPSVRESPLSAGGQASAGMRLSWYLPVKAGILLPGWPHGACHVSRDAMRVRWGHALTYRKLSKLPQVESGVRSLPGREGGGLTAGDGHPHPPPSTHTAAHVDCERAEHLCVRGRETAKGRAGEEWVINFLAPPPQAVTWKDLNADSIPSASAWSQLCGTVDSGRVFLSLGPPPVGSAPPPL